VKCVPKVTRGPPAAEHQEMPTIPKGGAILGIHCFATTSYQIPDKLEGVTELATNYQQTQAEELPEIVYILLKVQPLLQRYS
jgi:hypothetical protein